MSKPDKVKVWEWSTGKQAHFHHDFWWDKDDLVDAELVQGCTWLSDVLDGLRAKKIGIMLHHNGVWIRWQDGKGGGEVSSTNPTLNEALLAACLKYMEAKHE